MNVKCHNVLYFGNRANSPNYLNIIGNKIKMNVKCHNVLYFGNRTSSLIIFNGEERNLLQL